MATHVVSHTEIENDPELAYDPEWVYWQRVGYLLRECSADRQRDILTALSAEFRDLPEVQPLIEELLEKLKVEEDAELARLQAEHEARRQ